MKREMRNKKIKAWIPVKNGKRITKNTIINNIVLCRKDLPKKIFWGRVIPCEIKLLSSNKK